jgi:Family of unknown function (DUF5670)
MGFTDNSPLTTHHSPQVRKFIIARIPSLVWLLFYYSKTIFMSSLLYIIAVILIIGWVLGFFVFAAGNLIHILLVLAIIAILLRLIGGSRNPV